jgi:hypothetical protein
VVEANGLLFLSSIPITILMNSFRVGTIGVMVEHWGVGMAEGFLHEFQGWVVFMVSGAIMVLEMILLARIGHCTQAVARSSSGSSFQLPRRRSTGRSAPGAGQSVRERGVLILAAAVSLSLPERAESIPQRTSFAMNTRTPSAAGPAAANRWSDLSRVRSCSMITTSATLRAAQDRRSTFTSPGMTHSAPAARRIHRAAACPAAAGKSELDAANVARNSCRRERCA